MSSSITRSKKSTTVYTQIEGRLRHKIRQGDWPTGAMLPSRRDLAKEYGVSPITIDRAVSGLIAEGLLRADDRRGTFVTRAESTGNTSAPDVEIGEIPEIGVAWWNPSSQKSLPVAPTTIGIIAQLYLFRHDHLELHNFWTRLLLQSLEHTFSEGGRTTQFVNRVEEANRPLVALSDAILSLRREGVSAIAIIAIGVTPKEVDEELAVLEGDDVRVVCITSGALSRPVPHLFYDNRSVGYDAADHLLRCGCREILCLAPFTAPWVTERIDGVRAAVEHAGFAPDAVRIFPEESPEWVMEDDPEVDGYNAAIAALDAGLVACGVVCVNDGVAIGLMRAAAERGLTAGKDFMVVGFDDRPDARDVGLTSLRPPMEILAKEAARLLLRPLEGGKTDLQVRLRSHLIPRKSTRFTRI
jgi:DNA-binding LacI/PurR family transcriptional regulator/DNA-binding transcriptional regulator YhcF (GntR family)